MEKEQSLTWVQVVKINGVKNQANLLFFKKYGQIYGVW